MDVVFFGSGAFGLPTLEALSTAHTVRAVVTQPDRRAGRGGKLTPTPIGQFAEDSIGETRLFKPENTNVVEVREALVAIQAEAWVVIAFGQKLSRELLEGVFAINLHASLLPRWRGAAPINAAILAGDAETGNSVITLADRMDAGLVLGQSRRPITTDDTAGTLHDALAEDGVALLLDILSRFGQGQVEEHEQDELQVTLAPKLGRKDGWVDFADSAERCRCRINGLSPWPGVTVRFRSEPLKLVRAERVVSDPELVSEPGVVVDADAGVVGCGEGALRLLEVQPPGKKVMAWGAFARGRHVKRGERIEGACPQ